MTWQQSKAPGEIATQSGAGHEDLESLILFLVHDLEGPLAAAQSVLRLFDRDRYDPSNNHHRQLLRTSHIALERSRAIIGDLLTAGKLEAGEWSSQAASINLRDVLQDSMELVLASEDDGEAKIVTMPVDPILTVLADPKLLPRVVDNLLFNAVRNSPEKSEVRISVAVKPKLVQVDITNPIGAFGEVDPAELFEKFRQVQMRREHKHRGAGLGLYFCRLAVTAMKGTITAYLTPNNDICFSFTLQRGDARS